MKIITEMVDEGLTPILQVPDITVNKIFKAVVVCSGTISTIFQGIHFPFRV